MSPSTSPRPPLTADGYVASYHTRTGHYAFSTEYFTSADYRITWLPDTVLFYLEGGLVATHETAIRARMRPVASH